MNDTTGWKSGGRACGSMKDIDGVRYEITRGADWQWHLYLGGYCIRVTPTLADAKRAAHDHARSKHE